MSTYVELSLLKEQVNADDFTTDDTLLQHYLDAAEEYVIKATNRSADDLLEMNDGTMPLMLQQAILMTAAFWYDQREAGASASITAVPFAFDALVKPWRLLKEDSTDTSDEE